MSEFHVEVVKIGPVEKHPNADTLSITKIHGGYPVIFRTEEFKEGDLAAYLPVDSVVPETEQWAFLGLNRRIKARRLRGIFSMGLLAKAPEGSVEGMDVRELLGVVKYEPAEHLYTTGENEKDPGLMAIYDIEGLRKFKNVFQPGEEVWISEKIHGANARFVHDGERLWVGSHTCIKREDGSNLWWQTAKKYDLAAKLIKFPKIAIYGEIYGKMQDLRYGVPDSEGFRFIVFDVLNTTTFSWFNPDELIDFAASLTLPVVPTLYRGPWDPSLQTLAEGKTTLIGADNIREGIVVKPIKERVDPFIGRAFLKLQGEGYLTRKGA